MISPSLKFKVAISIFSEVVKQNKLFKRLIDDRLQSVMSKYEVATNEIVKRFIVGKKVNYIVSRL